ncbi:hypothetical protein ILUMI_05639 [Ignelater luminosus]|uniref:DUF7869 domain-containing protein n=1 Tax=Ignelater luminosus TaxID=2038154 RepID=A0A8K0DCL5_IGNLU|nr:hypothetical protein ILUMI_05639 [Ignelater luminosus]
MKKANFWTYDYSDDGNSDNQDADYFPRHEECWECEAFNIHKSSSHDNVQSDCDICQKYKLHKQRGLRTREQYQSRRCEDSYKENDALFLAADLQRVTKNVIIIPNQQILYVKMFYRLLCFHAWKPLKKLFSHHVLLLLMKDLFPWERKATFVHALLFGMRALHVDLKTISSQHSMPILFFKRDVKTIAIWLDNCSSQNKNWASISFFMDFVNSEKCAVEELNIKYFEPGHTFMATDSFLHQVELSLRKRNKVYEFDDFAGAVQAANSSKVEVQKLQIFYNFTNYTSKYKLQKLTSRFYTKDVVSFQLIKTHAKCFFYKTTFSDNFKKVNEIFNSKFTKALFTKRVRRTEFQSISQDRKTNLIDKLKSHIPPTRLKFWDELPVSASIGDNDDQQLLQL